MLLSAARLQIAAYAILTRILTLCLRHSGPAPSSRWMGQGPGELRFAYATLTPSLRFAYANRAPHLSQIALGNRFLYVTLQGGFLATLTREGRHGIGSNQNHLTCSITLAHSHSLALDTWSFSSFSVPTIISLRPQSYFSRTD